MSYVGPLTQIRIAISSVTVPSMEPMRDQYVFLIPKSRKMCIHFLYSVTIYIEPAFYFTEIIVLISCEGTPTQIRIFSYYLQRLSLLFL